MIQSPQYDLPRGLSGAADVWDRPQASAILLDEYFDQITSVTLAGNSAAQPNTSTSAGVVQTQVLSGNSAATQASATAGAASQDHRLAGASANEPNTATSGAVFQAHALAGADAATAGTSTSGGVIQAHLLDGVGVSAQNTSTSGAVAQITQSIDRTLKIKQSLRLAMIASDSRIMRVNRDNRVLQA